MALFNFGRPRPLDEARQRIETWARAAGGFGTETVLKVNEIVCSDPACPGFETVILVMEPGRRSVARKIAKPLAEVEEADVVHALTAQA